MEFIGCRSLRDPPGPPCRVCDTPPRLAFNWRYAQSDRGRDLHALVGQLAPVKALKFGHLYACRLCGLNWHLDAARSTMTRVPNNRRPLVNEWNDQRLAVEPDQLRALDTIGGTAARYWTGGDAVVAIPCAVTLRSGTIIDPAIVWITTRPPIDEFAEQVRFFRDVASVAASRFALPLDVRRATVLAHEAAMGFAPTRVVAANGTPYILQWAAMLFDQDGITGSEIRLSRNPFKRAEPIPIAETYATRATYILADWFEGAETLDKARPGHHSGLRAFWKRLL